MEHAVSVGNEGLVLDRDLYQRQHLQELGISCELDRQGSALSSENLHFS